MHTHRTITRFPRVLASPSRSSSRSARAIVARLGETPRSRRAHPSVPPRVSPASRIPRARVPSTRRIRAGAFRRLARAESRPSLSRAKIPARHRHPRSNAMDAHDSRARRRTGSNANARRTSSDARKVRARAHPRDRRRRRHARRRARVCRRARMGARRRGDEDDRLTVYAHECMWMTSIVVFISDVWNILSSYICFL